MMHVLYGIAVRGFVMCEWGVREWGRTSQKETLYFSSRFSFASMLLS